MLTVAQGDGLNNWIRCQCCHADVHVPICLCRMLCSLPLRIGFLRFELCADAGLKKFSKPVCLLILRIRWQESTALAPGRPIPGAASLAAQALRRRERNVPIDSFLPSAGGSNCRKGLLARKVFVLYGFFLWLHSTNLSTAL